MRLNPFARKSSPLPVIVPDGNRLASIRDVNGFLSAISLNLTSDIDCRSVTGQAQAYAINPIVNGVINARATAATQGIWRVTDKEGNEVRSDFDQVLRRPNPLQSWSQFINNANIFKDTFGRCYIYPLKGDSTQRERTKVFWVIPNWLVHPNYTGKTYMQSDLMGIVKDYSITGFSKNLLPDELIIWDDTGINTSQNITELVTHQSRLYGLSDQVSNILRAYEARRKIMTKGGPPGAWVNDNPKDAAGQNPKTPAQVQAVHNEFQRHGLGRDTSRLYAVLFDTWKWVQAGSPTKDLMLFEEIKDSAQIITFAYNLPEHLAPWGGDKTFNNVSASEKKFYNNAIIPSQQDFAAILTSWVGLDKYNQYITVTFDHLECFQADRKAEADAISVLSNAIDKNLRNLTITRLEARRILATYLDTAVFDPEKEEGELIELQGNTIQLTNEN